MKIHKSLVNVKNQTVKIRLLVGLVCHKQLQEKGVTDEQVGILLEDIAELGKILTPKKNYWWTEYFGAVNNVFTPRLRNGFPWLMEIDFQHLTSTNFEEWLGKLVNELGEDFVIRSIGTR